VFLSNTSAFSIVIYAKYIKFERMKVILIIIIIEKNTINMGRNKEKI